MASYRALDPKRILLTAKKTREQIAELFPGSGLEGVAKELVEVAHETRAQTHLISKPLWGLRIGIGLLVLMVVCLPCVALGVIELTETKPQLWDFLEATDAGIHILLVLAGGILFLVATERRIQRKRAMSSLNELRSLAHIIDMHQMSKDPITRQTETTDPEVLRGRTVHTPVQLGQYLDFSADMLSIVGKLAALYPQNLDDRDVLVAVNEIESLSTSTARKVWQKLMILNQVMLSGAGHWQDNFRDQTESQHKAAVEADHQL